MVQNLVFLPQKKCCELLSIKDGTEIRVICVRENITPAEPFGMTNEYLEIAQKASKDIVQEIAKETRQIMYAALSDLEVDIEIRTPVGSPKETIIEEAEEWGADLIVLGSQGHGFWGRTFLGSVSDAVVKHASCAVLVIRKNKDED